MLGPPGRGRGGGLGGGGSIPISYILYPLSYILYPLSSILTSCILYPLRHLHALGHKAQADIVKYRQILFSIVLVTHPLWTVKNA